jgi:diadenosine tetraphosphate (Ap4A) HIT family hydrolase
MTPLRRVDGRPELVVLEQPTRNGSEIVLTIPDALGINGDTQIGFSRASRIIQAGRNSPSANRLSVGCAFCGHIRVQEDRHALQTDNSRPFGPLVHKVIFSKDHIECLKDVGGEEIRDSTEQFFEIATRAYSQFGESFDGLGIGMNFGEYANSGASQAHFHYQVVGLGKANYNPGDRLGELCRAYRMSHAGADYLSDYEEALRRADLVVTETNDGLAFAYTPISPRFRGEIQILLRRRGRLRQAGNILETTAEERDALSRLQYDIIRRFAQLGCEALNQIWYMTRISTKNIWDQRMVISLCPRTSVLAFYELSGNSVIDTAPWVSAQALRTRKPSDFSLRP